MIEFNEGFTDGLTGFMDRDSRLTGESNRSGTYAFLLLAWPEAKAMLEAYPRKTLTDLHQWMKPFHARGYCAIFGS